MKTNNNIANYIASKGITKHMNREQAVTVWNALKAEGWRAEELTLVKVDAQEHHFVFERYGSKVAVSHREVEVAK